jgi:hypothetical protein
MHAAADELRRRADIRNRDRLNDVFLQVYETHCGAPPNRILAVLLERARSIYYEPSEATLRPAADAISAGRLYTFE